MQVSFSPEQMAPLDKKCQAFTFTGCLGGKKTKGGKQSESTTSCSNNGCSNKGRKEGWGQSGGFLEGGCLIVLNKGTFIFVLRPVTASGNSSVS